MRGIKPDGAEKRYLSNDGTQTGIINVNVAHPSPTKYWFGDMDEDIIDCNKFGMVLKCSADLLDPGYGTGAALTTGTTLTVEDDEGIIMDLTPLFPIKDSIDWLPVVTLNGNSSGRYMYGELYLPEIAQEPFSLGKKLNRRIVVTISDDLNALGILQHYFYVMINTSTDRDR